MIIEAMPQVGLYLISVGVLMMLLGVVGKVYISRKLIEIKEIEEMLNANLSNTVAETTQNTIQANREVISAEENKMREIIDNALAKNVSKKDIIIELARRCFSTSQIAKQLDKGKGEVELILTLRKKEVE